MNKLISAIFKKNKILYLVLLLIAHCSLLIAQTPSPLVQANFPSNGDSVNFTTFNLPVEVTFNPNNLNPKDTNTFAISILEALNNLGDTCLNNIGYKVADNMQLYLSLHLYNSYATYGGIHNYKTPVSSTPGFSKFNASNLYYTVDTSSYFFETNSNAYYNLGNWTPNTSLIDTTPLPYVNFPVSYGIPTHNVNYTKVKSTLSVGGKIFPEFSSVEATVKGFGQISIDTGNGSTPKLITYDSCFLVVFDEIDSVNYSSLFNNTAAWVWTETETYSIYSPHIPEPVVSIKYVKNRNNLENYWAELPQLVWSDQLFIYYVTSFKNIKACNLQVTTSVTNASCDTCPNGTATVNAMNGATPYTWTWYTSPLQTTQKVTNLKPGAYRVCVTDAKHCTTCVSVTIQSFTCQADFAVSQDTSKLYTYNFHDLSTATNKIVKWYWSFGDSTSSYKQSPAHTFSQSGNYNICLTISSFDSVFKDTCKNKYCKSLTIAPVDTSVTCYATFTYKIDSSDTTHKTYTFTNTSTITNLQKNETVNYFWQFNDGLNSYTKNPIHIFSEPDNYNICLRVEVVSSTDTTQVHCSSSSCKKILVGNPKYYNIGGQVFAGYFPVSSGYASIYRYRANKTVIRSGYMNFDTLGYYWFYQLMQGNYFVKITTNDNNYFPTYFGNFLLWNSSQLVDVSNSLLNNDIQLIPVNPKTGNLTITGSVVLNDSLGKDSIEIILFDQNLNPLNYTWADNNLKFQFNNLANGCYKLYAEISGWFGTYGEVCIDNNNPTANIILYSNYNDAIAVLKSDNSVNISDVYPNPVSSIMNINIDQSSVSVMTFDIYNTLGSIIESKSIRLDNGKNNLSFSVNNFAKGVYFVRIYSTDKDINAIRKFIIY